MERWYSHPSRKIHIVGHFALDTTFAYTPCKAPLSHNEGSQIVLAWKNTHAQEQNSFHCWLPRDTLSSTHGCRKSDFLVGRPKMLKYTPVVLGSRQFEDTLPQQQSKHFFHYFTAVCSCDVERDLTSSSESPCKVSYICHLRLPPSHRASPIHALSRSASF